MLRTLNWTPQNGEMMNALNQYRNMVSNSLMNIRGNSSQLLSEGIVTENIYESNTSMYIDGYQKQAQQSEQMVQFLEDQFNSETKRAESFFVNQDSMNYEFYSGRFITSYYDAKRTTHVGTPSGIVPMRFKNSYSVGTNISKNFLQYIVNLKAEQSFAGEENDLITRNRINDWFLNFQKQLRFIFDNENLTLKFDRRSFNYYIITDNRNAFDFNSMSEGFSAVLSIVTDLMLKTEHTSVNEYSAIILIDEVETHLHIDLQKKILPFLTNLFPNVQFIVTTHSPFILNSIPNTVIYDVERKARYEDFTAFSSEGIIEGYFRQDKYSEAIKQKVKRFEDLYGKLDLSEGESQELKFLKNYFEEIPKFYSKELELKIEQIKLSALV